MPPTAAVRERPQPDEVAALVENLRRDYGERAVTQQAIREQHSHGEGLADAALPDIVDQFIQPQKREMEEIVAALYPGFGREQVERCVFSMVGQVFFYRNMLPALTRLLGRSRLTGAWLRATAEHITEFSLGGMQRLAARAPAARRRAGRAV